MKQEGILNINKPAAITSYDVIRELKKVYGKVKIGHAGTLDPFATGVLIVAIGKKYTRQLSTFQKMEKTYKFTIQLGQTTTTLDPEGDVVQQQAVPDITLEVIEQCLESFLGDILQQPPIFSAKKINGKRAYKLARSGQQVDLAPAEVSIKKIECINYNPTLQQIECRVVCSKGTYIRALSRDIALKLGTVGYTIKLIREAIGDHTIVDAKSLESFSKSISS